MAPRANWKGYLRLSLVSCPIALYPATSEREKVSSPRINNTLSFSLGDRQPSTHAARGPSHARAVDDAQIVRGYEVAKGSYLELTDEELEAIAVESKRTIDIDEFVQKKRSTSSTMFVRTTLRRTATPE